MFANLESLFKTAYNAWLETVSLFALKIFFESVWFTYTLYKLVPLELVTVIQSLVSPFFSEIAAVTTSAGTVELEEPEEFEELEELAESESMYPAKPFLFAVFESSENALATSAKLSLAKALSILFFFLIQFQINYRHLKHPF